MLNKKNRSSYTDPVLTLLFHRKRKIGIAYLLLLRCFSARDAIHGNFLFLDDGIQDGGLATWTNQLGVLRNTQFNVRRPVADVASTTPAPHVELEPLGTSVSFGGTGPNEFGIKFDRTIANQTNPLGTTQWVQLVSTVIRATDYDGIPWRLLVSGALDSSYPYNDLIPPNIAKDGPRQNLFPEDRLVSRRDDFEMYLMWRSSKGNAIYVPLRSIDWFWRFSASSPNGIDWTLTSTDYSHDPLDQNTYEFPEWTDNIANYIDDGNLILERDD